MSLNLRSHVPVLHLPRGNLRRHLCFQRRCPRLSLPNSNWRWTCPAEASRVQDETDEPADHAHSKVSSHHGW